MIFLPPILMFFRRDRREKWTIEILPKVPNLVVRKIYVAFLRYVAFRTYVRPPRPDRLP